MFPGAKPIGTFSSRENKIRCYTFLLIDRNKICERIICLTPAGTTNLQRSWSARPDHVQVTSSCCCFLGVLVSFVCTTELVRFDPRHVTRSPPIGKRIWGITMKCDLNYGESSSIICCLFIIFTGAIRDWVVKFRLPDDTGLNWKRMERIRNAFVR